MHWSNEEKAYLYENWPTMKARDIGSHLGKSKQAVIHQARKMNLPHKNGRPKKVQYTWRRVTPWRHRLADILEVATEFWKSGHVVECRSRFENGHKSGQEVMAFFVRETHSGCEEGEVRQ